jgi:hypothetical protein
MSHNLVFENLIKKDKMSVRKYKSHFLTLKQAIKIKLFFDDI